MNRRRLFISFLVCCVLLLPLWAQGARVMGGDEQVEIPVGEEVLGNAASAADALEQIRETPAVMEPIQAETSSAGHVTMDHYGVSWTPCGDIDTLKGITTGTVANYYLTGDISGRIIIPSGANITLCLNGCTLSNNPTTPSPTANVIQVMAGGTLTLCDCAGGGKITGGKGLSGGAVTVMGRLNMNSGSITGNGVANCKGGGVCVNNGGTFSMSGGTITGNTASAGGGVYVNAGGTFILFGGAITNNTAGNGGGVLIAQGNSASGLSDGALRISGDPVISGNKTSGNVDNNVYLGEGQVFQITGALTCPDGSIGLTMAEPAVFTAGNAVTNTDYAAKFVVDGGVCTACAAGDQLSLGGRLIYAKPDGVSGTVPAEPTTYTVGTRVTLDTTLPLTPADPNYRQVGWSVSPNASTTDRWVDIKGITTVYPVFKRPFVATDVSDTLELTYATEMDEVNLNRYIKFLTGAEGVSGSFQFERDASSGTNITGLKVKKEEGTLSGKPMIKPSATPYTYVITVTDVQSASQSQASLSSLTPTEAYGTGKLSLSVLVAKKDPTAADFRGIELVGTPYADGTAKAVTVTPCYPDGMGDDFTLSCVGIADLANIPADIQAGTYTVTAEVAGNDYYNAGTVTLGTFTISSWEAPELVAPTPEAVTYRPNLRLTGIQLGGNWRWESPNTGLQAGTSQYLAYYIIPNEDLTKYNWSALEGYDDTAAQPRVSGVSITVRVDPADPTVPTTVFTATEGQTLADIQDQLPAGWTWADGTTSVGAAGTKTFPANYDPTGTEQEGNYKAVAGKLLNVKVDAAQTPPTPEVLTIRPAANWTGGAKVDLDITGEMPANVVVVAVKLTDGAMTDLAWNGALSGNAVTFTGKTLAPNQGWKLLFLTQNTWAPVHPPVELKTN